jgi:hypothetical protein
MSRLAVIRALLAALAAAGLAAGCNRSEPERSDEVAVEKPPPAPAAKPAPKPNPVPAAPAPDPDLATGSPATPDDAAQVAEDAAAVGLTTQEEPQSAPAAGATEP